MAISSIILFTKVWKKCQLISFSCKTNLFRLIKCTISYFKLKYCTSFLSQKIIFHNDFLHSYVAPRGCVVSQENICFICCDFTVKSQQKFIIDFVMKVFFSLLPVKIKNHGFLTSNKQKFKILKPNNYNNSDLNSNCQLPKPGDRSDFNTHKTCW